MRIQRRGPFLILSILLLIVSLFLLCFFIAHTVPEFNQYRLVRTYPQTSISTSNSRKVRTILLWNSFFGDKRWSLPGDSLGPTDFRDDLQCPVYQCELSNKHDFLPSIVMYDAIVFHTAEPFPILNSVPMQRKSNQLYVFALMEPPSETKHILNDEQDFYNLTMTYRLDSDIVWPYKRMVDIETGLVVAPAKYPKWRTPSDYWNSTEAWNLWLNKTSDVAWFVSHCDTLSKREKLVEALQRHIDVDIYGKCGPMSCQRFVADCDVMLDYKYKFYLSFENILCKDYVTEKLFNAMQRTIIPVVFGGANYAQFAPPHSFINAQDFPSVKELAAYLKYLSKNPTEYLRYFWWRRYYRLADHSPFCDLCEKLHNPNYELKTQSYRNIEKWWIGGSCNFTAQIKY